MHWCMFHVCNHRPVKAQCRSFKRRSYKLEHDGSIASLMFYCRSGFFWSVVLVVNGNSVGFVVWTLCLSFFFFFFCKSSSLWTRVPCQRGSEIGDRSWYLDRMWCSPPGHTVVLTSSPATDRDPHTPGRTGLLQRLWAGLSLPGEGRHNWKS